MVAPRTGVAGGVIVLLRALVSTNGPRGVASAVCAWLGESTDGRWMKDRFGVSEGDSDGTGVWVSSPSVAVFSAATAGVCVWVAVGCSVGVLVSVGIRTGCSVVAVCASSVARSRAAPVASSVVSCALVIASLTSGDDVSTIAVITSVCCCKVLIVSSALLASMVSTVSATDLRYSSAAATTRSSSCLWVTTCSSSFKRRSVRLSRSVERCSGGVNTT